MLGDPTVATFCCRDTDSYLSEREAAAVQEWLNSGRQWHVMRDIPNHRATILAGLWGGHNYQNISLATQLRSSLLENVKPSLVKSLDQDILNQRVWPFIRKDAVVHDSYHCENTHIYGETR